MTMSLVETLTSVTPSSSSCDLLPSPPKIQNDDRIEADASHAGQQQALAAAHGLVSRELTRDRGHALFRPTVQGATLAIEEIRESHVLTFGAVLRDEVGRW